MAIDKPKITQAQFNAHRPQTTTGLELPKNVKFNARKSKGGLPALGSIGLSKANRRKFYGKKTGQL